MESSDRAGELAGGVASTLAFLDSVLDRSSGHLRLERRGRIWEAVATARRMEATGKGRLVAVIDGGFDASVAGLTNRLHPASTVRADTLGQTKGHGTAVALLIREVAPDCELLLIDVTSPTSGAISPTDVGHAIDVAREQNADVINLSLEFPTDCPLRDTSWISLDVLTTAEPDIADYLAQVDAWIAHAEPYADARCRVTCAICDALGSLPLSTLVVAAAGNGETSSCPACFDRVVGAGFHQSQQLDVGGVVYTTSGLPETRGLGPVARSETLIEEPPGFLGTSFAAPLLSGLGALVPEPAVLANLAKMSQALDVVRLLANAQWNAGPDALSVDAPVVLHQGLLRFAEAMPASHRHFAQSRVSETCVMCTLLLVDWYDTFVSMLILSGNAAGALAIARNAATMAPETASVSGNYGLAAEVVADESADSKESDELRREAVLAYTNAVRIAPTVSLYVEALARMARPVAG